MAAPRSKLFISGDRLDGLADALAAGPDALSFDLEDGVAETGKAAAGLFPEPVAAVVLTHAQVTFKGQAPGTAGVMQVNATIAADAPVGNAVPLRLMSGGVAAQEVMVAIQ